MEYRSLNIDPRMARLTTPNNFASVVREALAAVEAGNRTWTFAIDAVVWSLDTRKRTVWVLEAEAMLEDDGIPPATNT